MDDEQEEAKVLLDRLRSGHATEHDTKRVLQQLAAFSSPHPSVTQQLVELLGCMMPPGPRVIVDWMVQVAGSSVEEMQSIVSAYKQLVDSDEGMTVPVIKSLADLPLPDALKLKVFQMSTESLSRVDESHVPDVVRGLVASLTKTNAKNVLEIVFQQLSSLSPETILKVVTVFAQAVRVNHNTARILLNLLSRSSDLSTLDVHILLLLYARPRERHATMKALVRAAQSGALQLSSLVEVCGQAGAIPAIPHAMLALCCELLRVKDTALHSWLPVLLLLLFREHAELRNDILSSLMSACANDSSDVLASHVLAAIATQEPRLLAIHAHLVEDLLYSLTGSNVLVTHNICRTIAQLCDVKPDFVSSIKIFVQKSLFCGTSEQQLAGVIACTHLVRADRAHPHDQQIFVRDAIKAVSARGDFSPTVIAVCDLLRCAVRALEPDTTALVWSAFVEPTMRTLNILPDTPSAELTAEMLFALPGHSSDTALPCFTVTRAAQNLKLSATVVAAVVGCFVRLQAQRAGSREPSRLIQTLLCAGYDLPQWVAKGAVLEDYSAEAARSDARACLIAAAVVTALCTAEVGERDVVLLRFSSLLRVRHATRLAAGSLPGAEANIILDALDALPTLHSQLIADGLQKLAHDPQDSVTLQSEIILLLQRLLEDNETANPVQPRTAASTVHELCGCGVFKTIVGNTQTLCNAAAAARRKGTRLKASEDQERTQTALIECLMYHYELVTSMTGVVQESAQDAQQALLELAASAQLRSGETDHPLETLFRFLSGQFELLDDFYCAAGLLQLLQQLTAGNKRARILAPLYLTLLRSPFALQLPSLERTLQDPLLWIMQSLLHISPARQFVIVLSQITRAITQIMEAPDESDDEASAVSVALIDSHNVHARFTETIQVVQLFVESYRIPELADAPFTSLIRALDCVCRLLQSCSRVAGSTARMNRLAKLGTKSCTTLLVALLAKLKHARDWRSDPEQSTGANTSTDAFAPLLGAVASVSTHITTLCNSIRSNRVNIGGSICKQLPRIAFKQQQLTELVNVTVANLELDLDSCVAAAQTLLSDAPPAEELSVTFRVEVDAADGDPWAVDDAKNQVDLPLEQPMSDDEMDAFAYHASAVNDDDYFSGFGVAVDDSEMVPNQTDAVVAVKRSFLTPSNDEEPVNKRSRRVQLTSSGK